MSESKLDVVVPGGYAEDEFIPGIGKANSGEKASAVYRILNGIRQQGDREFDKFATKAERRAISDRFFRGNVAANSGSISVPIDGDEKREHGSGGKSGPLLSGTAYCLSSCCI